MCCWGKAGLLACLCPLRVTYTAKPKGVEAECVTSLSVTCLHWLECVANKQHTPLLVEH